MIAGVVAVLIASQSAQGRTLSHSRLASAPTAPSVTFAQLSRTITDGFATTFASPGRLAIARLQYDGGGDWYANPSSLPNLLRAIAERTDLPVERTEGRVRLTDSAVFDYPFLHVTGHGEIKFSNLEIERLRE